jgi:hypothetical protein
METSVCAAESVVSVQVSMRSNAPIQPERKGPSKPTRQLKALIPGNISFTAGDVILCFCAVTFAGTQSDAKFSAWNASHHPGWKDAFE